jgi:histone-lysine N-methyltransferase SETMAR
MFLDQKMGCTKNPPGINKHTWSEHLWVISDQNLVAEVQGQGYRVQRPPTGRSTTLDFGAQLEAFLQKYPFASASMIAKHFLVNPHMVKEIIQRELRMRKFSRRWVPHSLTPAQKVPRVDTSIEMLRILQESEANDFDGVTTGDESWFQYIYPSSEMFARSPADGIPRTRQALCAKKIMITLFFTARKLIVLDVMPKGWKYNQRYFVDNRVLGLKRGKMSFARRKPGSTCWVHMDNSIWQSGAKITSEFQKHHLARMPHPPYSPDISPCDCWRFGMLKGILKDREFVSSEEIEVAIADVWNGITSDEMQSVFRNWMSRLTWVIENGAECILE